MMDPLGAAEVRASRLVVGEPGWKGRGVETRARDARRETDEGEMLRDDVGEGGEADETKLPDIDPLRDGGDPAPRISTPSPAKLPESRDFRFVGETSLVGDALRTAERPLALPTDRTRGERAERDESTSGLLSRVSPPICR